MNHMATRRPYLDQLTAFALVAEERSFSAAARVLNRDTSVITRRIHSLEKRLGVRLIERTTRRMVLSEAGEAYLNRVRGALDQLALADAEAGARSTVPRGVLRLSLPQAYGRARIAPLIPGFLAKYPEITVEGCFADRFVDLIGEGFDAAIRLGVMQDSNLVARKLASFRREVYASPDYLQRWGRPRQPEDLARHRCLGFTRSVRPDLWTLTKSERHKSVQVNTVFLSDEVAALVTACASGAGLMIAADWLVAPQVNAGQLERVLPQWQVGKPSVVCLVTPSGRLLPSKTRVFIDWVAQQFE